MKAKKPVVRLVWATAFGRVEEHANEGDNRLCGQNSRSEMLLNALAKSGGLLL